MGVAYDNHVESHTGTTGSVSEASFSFNLTPVGTPRGILVFTFCLDSATEEVTGVTYGGVAMTKVTGGSAADTATEPGRVTAWFLGSSVPTGTQAVVVSRNNNANTVYAVATSVTALTDTEITGIVLEQENQTLTEENVDDGSPGTDSLRFQALYTGLGTLPTIGANSTTYTTTGSIDLGAKGATMARETTPGQGARPVGRDASGDDVAAVYLAVSEVVGGGAANVTGTASLSSSASLTATGQREVVGSAALSSSAQLAAQGLRTVLGAASLQSEGLLAATGLRTVVGSAILGDIIKGYAMTLASTLHGWRHHFTATPGQEYTFSFYAKRGTATDVKLSVYDWSNFADIVGVTSYYSRINGTDWSRVTVTFTAPSGCTDAAVYLARDSSATGTVYVAAAQVEIGPTATAWERTNGSAGPKNLLAYGENLAGAGWLTFDGSQISVAQDANFLEGVYAILYASGVGSTPSGTTVFGTASLVSSGSLTAQGQREVVGAAALSSSASLVASGIRTVLGVASLASQGTLTAAGVRQVLGVAALTSAAILSAQGQRTVFGSASLASSGLLVVTGISTTPGGAGEVVGIFDLSSGVLLSTFTVPARSLDVADAERSLDVADAVRSVEYDSPTGASDF